MFDKGIKFGITLLLIFPLMALLFGGAKLAAAIIMSSSDSVLVQLTGALASIAPLWAVPGLVSKFNSVTGKFGLPGAGFRLNGLKKRAEGYRDYRKNVARGRRYERASGERGVGKIAAKVGPPGSKRRNVAQWLASSGVAGGDNRRDKYQNAERAANEARQTYAAQRITSEMAANGGQSAFAKKLAGPTGNVSRIQASAVATDQATIAQAVKDAQTMMSATIPPGSVDKMGQALADAIRDNDHVKAQAAQNMLMASGAAGLKQYRSTMTDIGNNDPALMNNDASVAMRKNMLQNHSAKKADAADLIAQAVSGKTMGDVSNDKSTWEGLSDNELVKQKHESIDLAVRSGAVDQSRADDIMHNSELYDNLKPESKALLDKWRKAPPGTDPKTL